MNTFYVIGIVRPKYVKTNTMNILEYDLDSKNLTRQESLSEKDNVNLEATDELKSKLMHGRNSNMIY